MCVCIIFIPEVTFNQLNPITHVFPNMRERFNVDEVSGVSKMPRTLACYV